MPAGPMGASDVDCAAEAPQGGLMECLGQGWVGVDGPGHVLEKCPHFDRQCELSDEFRNMGADRLDAEHANDRRRGRPRERSRRLSPPRCLMRGHWPRTGTG